MQSSQLCVGILAHVDAGKTTLSEALLYTCGNLRRLGRVDHGDAFLDNFSLERERGITIFSKQASLSWEGLSITLLDTPGHVDFSAEMERTLQVLDYAILVINGSDGIQGHTKTLWKLLAQYRIPVFLFVNKMDQPGADKGKLLRELQAGLDGNCLEFGPSAEAEQDFAEKLAMCSESLMEEYLETEQISDLSVAKTVKERLVFPCFFGSALRLTGVRELLDGIRRYAMLPEYGETFGARVYKISRDGNGNRLTHLKVTGGELRVKMPVSNGRSAAGAEEIWEEKADQLRVYEGAQFQAVDRVPAGGICAVMGLKKTFAGQGLGAEAENELPVLAPVLTYRLILPEGSDVVKVLGQMRCLEEEEPALHVVWREAAKEIHVQIMGEVQLEILKRLISERFGLEVEFGDGKLVYKETITGPVVGIGHFEPLRHYAEVQLLLEPGEPGSGIQLASACSTDVLDRNWQRLIFTHLEERTHPGVLTGSPLTDVKVTLLTGRAHIKHTEGGDFRQATYRALRQGLMQARNVLLEPVFSFTLEVPTEQLGRAMSDIQKRCGSFDAPVTEGDRTILTGSAPVACMRDYGREVNAYTRGQGRLSCLLKGYEPCHNTEEVLAEIGYDPEGDTENPSSSVFCAHGAGFVVNWEQVPEYAHLESGWSPETAADGQADGFEAALAADWSNGGKSGEGNGSGEAIRSGFRGRSGAGYAGTSRRDRSSQTGSGQSDYITQEEIEEIFQRTYGKSVRDYEPYRYHGRNTGVAVRAAEAAGEEAPGEAVGGTVSGEGGERYRRKSASSAPKKEEYLLVDGYNIIFAWEELRSLAAVNIDSARDKLMDICCNYQGYQGCTLILVYDAYKVKGNPGSVQKYHNIYVVYTKEAETADQYIEKTVHEIGKKHHVTVATSDGLEQMIIWGEGAVRMSANGFREAVEAASAQLREQYLPTGKQGINRIKL